MGSDTLFGRPIPSMTLIAGLKELNPLLHAPLPADTGNQYGMTSLWLGMPFAPESQKVTAFHLAMPDGTAVVPEYSLIDKSIFPDGTGEALPEDVARKWRKGWRAIFDACIRSRVITRRQLEQKFNVVLTHYGSQNPACDTCEKLGVKRPAASMHTGLCEFHDGVQKMAAQSVATQKEESLVSRNHHG